MLAGILLQKVVDRLERGGFVYRRADPQDSRKVIIQLDLEQTGRTICPLFASMGNDFRELCDSYSTAELTILYRFMLQATDNLRRQIGLLRDGGGNQQAGG